jgi:hypothetical protein
MLKSCQALSLSCHQYEAKYKHEKDINSHNYIVPVKIIYRYRNAHNKGRSKVEYRKENH